MFVMAMVVCLIHTHTCKTDPGTKPSDPHYSTYWECHKDALTEHIRQDEVANRQGLTLTFACVPLKSKI